VRRLLTISAEMKTSRPVFIVGEARSGTSILYRTLQKHSSFRPLRTNLVETEIFSHLRRTFMFSTNYPRSLIRFMLDDEVAYREFLRSIRVIRLLSALAIGLNLVVRDRSDLVWYANLNHLLLRSYFFHAARARGCRRLVEKTPTNSPNIHRLWRSFPRAQFLYMYRHPVDVFSSYRRRAKDDPAADWAEQISADDFCETYRASLGRVLRWTRDHRNLRMIRYEDFTRRPERTFSGVCEFLKESDEPHAVEEQDPDLGRWKGDPHLWGEIVPATKNWRDFITADEADVIQTTLAYVMDRIGYEPYQLR
jgi:ribosomal protein L34E